MAKLCCLLSLVMVSGCAGVGKNPGSGSAAAQMSCTSPTDPNCIGQAGAFVQIPLGSGVKSLQGQCELIVTDEANPRPCEGVQLVFRSAREEQERTAVVKGFRFHIDDLAEDTYRVRATSPIYDLETDTKQMINNPSGQTVKIRVRAKPRP